MPLGVDIGTSRVRISLAERNRAGTIRLRAVASRDVLEPEAISGLLLDMRAEIGVRERRCVSAFGAPEAALRLIRFPKMSHAERRSAARFEAQRFTDWDLEQEKTLVRVHAADTSDGWYAVGAVRSESIERRRSLLMAAKLRALAIDHETLALQRVLPGADAIVDVGCERTRVHCFTYGGPRSWLLSIGGASVTRGISNDLGIDIDVAERRKRIVGHGGAGLRARDELVMAIAAAIEQAGAKGGLRRIALCGNGARLPSFAEALETATGAHVEFPVAEVLLGDAYPADVVRAAAPDWTLAAGLALWSAAA
jgi:Tfp pilus assembly PilM family ATPase